MKPGCLLGRVSQASLELLLAPGAAQVLMFFEQLFKSFKIYLLNASQSCLLGNKLNRESVGGKELECVRRRERPLGGKPRELLHPALQGLPKARFFRSDFCNACQVAEFSVPNTQGVGIAHR